jgi:hypothetical protein
MTFSGDYYTMLYFPPHSSFAFDNNIVLPSYGDGDLPLALLRMIRGSHSVVWTVPAIAN